MSKEESGTNGDSRISIAEPLGTFIGLLVACVAILCLYVFLADKLFGLQIATLITYTGAVFFLVFCDSRWFRGYSLRRKPVQQQIPRLLVLHGVFLACIFAAQTYALSLRPHLSAFWLQEGPREDSWFFLALLLVCTSIGLTQIYVSRRILDRSIANEKATELFHAGSARL